MSSSSSEQTSPLGLTLRKTPSFLNLVEMKLAQSRTKKHKTEDPGKLKATNFPAVLLKIGSWEVTKTLRNKEKRANSSFSLWAMCGLPNLRLIDLNTLIFFLSLDELNPTHLYT